MAQPVSEVVQIDGPEGPLEAEALLAPGAAHAVIVIPGSGPTDRDGNSSGGFLNSDTYRLLAEALAAEGITAIRIDKRGLFGSAAAVADPNAVTIAGYAEDVLGWAAYAAETGAPCVWLAGHSEGGLVALVAAQTDPQAVCGLILLATPGRPVGQLLLEQLRANPMNAPFMAELEAVVADMEAGRARPETDISPELRPLFSDGLQRFMMDLFSYDPAVLAGSWAGPALIVQGGKDMQVRDVDAQALAAAMAHAHTVTLADGTHMLKTDVPGQPFATYSDASLPLHTALVPAIVAYLNGLPRE